MYSAGTINNEMSKKLHSTYFVATIFCKIIITRTSSVKEETFIQTTMRIAI